MSSKKKLSRSRVKWTDHVNRFGDNELKEIGCPESGGKRRQGRARMRWEDFVKRDLERGGGEWRIT